MNPSAIQLEVGKSYQVRDPKWSKRLGVNPIQKIVRYDRGKSMPFVSDCGYAFFNSGFALEENRESIYDLVKEVLP